MFKHNSETISLNEAFKDLPLEAIIESNLLSIIASQIQDTRVKLGMTQEDLAGKLDVNQSLISRYENGQENLTIKSIAKIFGCLGIKVGLSFEGANLMSAEDSIVARSKQNEWKGLSSSANLAECFSCIDKKKERIA